MRIAYLNKKFVPLEKATIPILDRGFLYGDGAFETMRSYGGVPFLIEKHVSRLSDTLRYLGIRPPATGKKIREIIFELLEVNKLKNAYIKVIITRGPGRGLLLPASQGVPTLAAYALPERPLSRHLYDNGIAAILSRSRSNATSSITGHKTLNYLDKIMARIEGKKRKADDTIFLNSDGFVSEATGSNVFLARKGELYTPDTGSGILPGVTRNEVKKIAVRYLKLKVHEKELKKNALFSADEIFLTNSMVEVLPVVKINGRPIADGRPGAITRSLAGFYKEAVSAYCERGRWR